MADETVEALGLNIEPTTGNEIPPGSLPSEVRDDVPAMLSEGEYVVPADVLRFFGVKFFEDLRRQAKTELAMMEQEGRVGGEPMEEGDPLPFSLDELEVGDADDDIPQANEGLLVSGEEADMVSGKFGASGSTLVEFISNTGTSSWHRRLPSSDGDGYVFVPPVPNGYRMKDEVLVENTENNKKIVTDDDKGDGAYDEGGNWQGSGNQDDLDDARDDYIEKYNNNTFTAADKLFMQSPMYKGLTFLDKTATGWQKGGKKDTTQIERAMNRLRTQFKTMKPTDPKYDRRKELIEQNDLGQQFPGDASVDSSNAGDFTGNMTGLGSGATPGGFGGTGQGRRDYNKGGLAMKKSKKTYGKGYNKGGAVKGYTTAKKPKYSKGGLATKKK